MPGMDTAPKGMAPIGTGFDTQARGLHPAAAGSDTMVPMGQPIPRGMDAFRPNRPPAAENRPPGGKTTAPESGKLAGMFIGGFIAGIGIDARDESTPSAKGVSRTSLTGQSSPTLQRAVMCDHRLRANRNQRVQPASDAQSDSHGIAR